MVVLWLCGGGSSCDGGCVMVVLLCGIHQQKKTCLQLPYNALLCLTEPVKHNKAL